MSLECVGEANFSRLHTLYQTYRDEGKCTITSPSGTLLIQERPLCEKANQAGILISIIRVKENTVRVSKLHIDNEGLVRGKVYYKIDTSSHNQEISAHPNPGNIIEMADRIIRESRRRPRLVLVTELPTPTPLPALVAV